MKEYPITLETKQNLAHFYKDLPSNSSILSDQFEKSFTSNSLNSSFNKSFGKSVGNDSLHLNSNLDGSLVLESDLQETSNEKIDANINCNQKNPEHMDLSQDVIDFCNISSTLTQKFKPFILHEKDLSDDDTYKFYDCAAKYPKKGQKFQKSKKFTFKKNSEQKFKRKSEGRSGGVDESGLQADFREDRKEASGKVYSSAGSAGKSTTNNAKKKHLPKKPSPLAGQPPKPKPIPLNRPENTPPNIQNKKILPQTQKILELGSHSWQVQQCENILKTQVQSNPHTIYLSCPFDPNHKVSQKLYKNHVLACRDVYSPKTEILICPYNSRHLLMAGSYKKHVENCEDQGTYAGEIANGMAELAVEI